MGYFRLAVFVDAVVIFSCPEQPAIIYAIDFRLSLLIVHLVFTEYGL